jgi:hypothetical protein
VYPPCTSNWRFARFLALLALPRINKLLRISVRRGSTPPASIICCLCKFCPEGQSLRLRVAFSKGRWRTAQRCDFETTRESQIFDLRQPGRLSQKRGQVHRLSFQISALLLAILEALGCWIGLRIVTNAEMGRRAADPRPSALKGTAARSELADIPIGEPAETTLLDFQTDHRAGFLNRQVQTRCHCGSATEPCVAGPLLPEDRSH